MFKGLSDLIYPNNCVLCRTFFPCGNSPTNLCPDCLDTMEHNLPPFCAKCSKHLVHVEQRLCFDCLKRDHYFDGAFSACFYNDTMRRLLHLFKYANKTSLRHYLGNLMISFIKTTPVDLKDTDVLVPVPLHPVRLRERGYNQSALLAEKIAHRFDLPVSSDNLIRIRHTQNQALIGVKNRWTNIQGAFRIKHSSRFLEKSVLLVDDLLTTGATVSEAARVLKSAGAKKVHVLTAALAQ